MQLCEPSLQAPEYVRYVKVTLLKTWWWRQRRELKMLVWLGSYARGWLKSLNHSFMGPYILMNQPMIGNFRHSLQDFFSFAQGQILYKKLIIESWERLKQHPPIIFTATNWTVVQNSQLNARQDQMSHFITSIHKTEVEVPFIQVQEQWRRSVYMYTYTTNYVSTNAKSHYISWINQPFLTER